MAEGLSRELDALRPRSPYASAKAAGELLATAYNVTHGTDVVITRGSNTYGPHQHPEKIIPLFVTNALEDEPLPLYGDGRQQRDWLFVDDHADAVGFVLDHGVSGEVYNVTGTDRLPNRVVTSRSWRWSTSHGRSCAASPIDPATTFATQWMAPSWRSSAGGRRSTSTMAWRARSPGFATTPIGGAGPSPATGATTTNSSTAGGWPSRSRHDRGRTTR